MPGIGGSGIRKDVGIDRGLHDVGVHFQVVGEAVIELHDDERLSRVVGQLVVDQEPYHVGGLSPYRDAVPLVGHGHLGQGSESTRGKGDAGVGLCRVSRSRWGRIEAVRPLSRGLRVVDTASGEVRNVEPLVGLGRRLVGHYSSAMPSRLLIESSSLSSRRAMASRSSAFSAATASIILVVSVLTECSSTSMTGKGSMSGI